MQMIGGAPREPRSARGLGFPSASFSSRPVPEPFTRAAERVGMHRQSLQHKLKDLGLTRRYVLQDEAQDSDDE